MSQTRPWNLPA